MSGHIIPPCEDKIRELTLVDTHIHLSWESFDDLPEVIERARSAGVTRMLAVALDLSSSTAVQTIAAQYDEVYASAGIHPNSVRSDDDWRALRHLACGDRVVAIGETGLDYYRDHVPHSLQRASFYDHLDLAEELRLPIIIHNREADEDIIAALASRAGRVHGVLHCFSGSKDIAEQAIAYGFAVSFAGNLTYPSAANLRAVAAALPVDTLLTETDAPFLSPVPHRGKRNEPAHVRYTLKTLATCRNADPVELAAHVAHNAARVFGW